MTTRSVVQAGAAARLAPLPAVDEEDAVVAALRAGDEHAFRVLVERHGAMMRRVARSYVECDAVADEVVQETWAGVVRGIGRFERRSTLATWIFSILVNQARTHCGRERRMLPFSCFASADDEPAVDPDLFRSDDDPWPGPWAAPPRPWQKPERRLLALETRGRLRAAMHELPMRQRVVVAMRDVDGIPADDVCALLGLSAENQRVLLHRGRARLRAALEPYLDDVAA